MPDSFFRLVLDKLFPVGAPYNAKGDGDMSKYLDGTAENLDLVRADVKNLAYIRNPEKTPVLRDLEREYGKNNTANQTLQQRTDTLKAEVYKKQRTAADDELQAALDRGGFNVTVYNNSPNGPAVDPAIFLDQNFQLQAKEGNYYAGNDDAYAGRVGGELLVNGRLYTLRPGYLGAGDIYAGNTTATAGYYTTNIRELITYEIPVDPANWPFVFFIGGDATFNPDGSLLTIEQGLIPSERRKDFEDIVLKFKPLHSWAALIITFN